MALSPLHRIARAGRAILAPAALCLAATGAQAQLVSGLLTTTIGTLDSLTDVLREAAPANHALRRDARVVAADAAACRAQERHRGVQRLSYGTASPRGRQLLNDCTPMGAPTDPAAP